MNSLPLLSILRKTFISFYPAAGKNSFSWKMINFWWRRSGEHENTFLIILNHFFPPTHKNFVKTRTDWTSRCIQWRQMVFFSSAPSEALIRLPLTSRNIEKCHWALAPFFSFPLRGWTWLTGGGARLQMPFKLRLLLSLLFRRQTLTRKTTFLFLIA